MVELGNRLLRMAADDRAAPFAERPGFDRLRARLRDRGLEAEYQAYLVDVELKRERLIWCLMTAVYFAYGFLDIFTIKERTLDVLVVRWGVFTPLAVCVALATFHPKLKRYFGQMFAGSVFLSALSIIWMISIMPPGGPPYLVGILVVFIFASCNLRMPFIETMTAYTCAAIIYSAVLLNSTHFTPIDVIAGHFFMISSALVGVVTNYVQEIRLRLIWAQQRQRRIDAARIQELMIEATAADQSKLNFLSILNHELRTPLHQIMGFSEVAARSKGENAGDDFSGALDHIHAAAARLLTLFAKMLRYADATAGKIRYEFEWLSVNEIMDIAIEPLTERAAAKSVKIIKSERNETAFVLVDQASTSYALGHLIENALNASPNNGLVTLSFRFDADGACVIEVADQGPGMSATEIDRAFAPFTQIGAARTRSGDGLGLGLSLARKIFTDQQITLTLDAKPGEGLTARLVVPPNAARRPESARITAAS